MAFNVKSIFNKSNNELEEINKYIRVLEGALGTIKGEVSASITNKDRLRRELHELEDSMSKYDRYIQRARDSGNSRDVIIYEDKKEEILPRYNEIKDRYYNIGDEVNKISEMESKLSRDICELRERINILKSISHEEGNKIETVKEEAYRKIFQAEALEELNNLKSVSTDEDFDAEFEKLLNDEI